MFGASKTSTPSGGGADPQFNYVTMLLHGDGTNGAQNNTFLDSSSNNRTITRTGTPTQGSFSPYGSNWSNYFNDSSNLDVTLISTLGTGNFTVECWFNNADLVNQPIFSIGTFSSGIDVRISESAPSKLDVICFGSFKTVTFTAANAWQHLAIVRNSGTITIYLNGAIFVAGFSDTNNYLGSLLRVGGLQAGGATRANFLGYISNFRITNTAVYTTTFTPSTTPLTAISGTQALTCQSNRFKDNSTNNCTVTLNGTPSVQRFNPFGTATAYSTSVIGGSGYFDGSGDYLFLASNAAFQFGTGDFTVEGWFYQTADNTYPSALELGPHVGVGGIVFITKYGGNATIYANGFFGSTPTLLNQWNHIAWVRSSGSLKIYVNGVSPAGVGFTNDLNNTSTGISIGDAVSLTSSSYDYSGYMSNMRVVKGTAVYTANFTPPTTPLTAISGTSLLTNFTNGAIFDNAMMNDLETVGNAQISTSVVKFGTGSLYFDGTGDYLSTPSAPTNQMGAGPFTIEAWIYPTTISGTHTIVGKYVGGSTANSEYWLFITSTGRLAFAVDGSGAEDYIQSEVGTIVVNTWTYVTAIKTSSAIAIYINGTQAASAASAFTLSTNATPLNIGSYNNGLGTYFGYIDDLRITKGIARYSGSSFTVPTAAFPNTGPY